MSNVFKPISVQFGNLSLDLYYCEETGEIGTSLRGVAAIASHQHPKGKTFTPEQVKRFISKQGVTFSSENEVQILTEGGLQGVTICNSESLFEFLIKVGHTPLALAMGKAGSRLFLLQAAGLEIKVQQPVQPSWPQLPPHVEAVQVSDAIVRMHETLAIYDPRLAQILIDRAMQTVMAHVALPAATVPSLAGAVEIATDLGYKVGKELSTLGKAVAKAWRSAYDTEPQEAKRECGGAMRRLKVYPSDDPIVVTAIREFYGESITQ